MCERACTLSAWARQGPGETLDALAFRSDAVLATLHPVAAGSRPEAPGALLRDRLALQAAEACARLVFCLHAYFSSMLDFSKNLHQIFENSRLARSFLRCSSAKRRVGTTSEVGWLGMSLL